MSASLRGVAPVLLVAAVGCTGSPIGDPCVPEIIPEGGFDGRDVSLETGSVQCRTRTCLVYRLSGNPQRITGTDTCPAGDTTCVSRQAAENHVFCSCRCSTPNDQANTPLCDCGDGFVCQENAVSRRADPGQIGGYCVPCIKKNDDRGLDALVFEACPTDD